MKKKLFFDEPELEVVRFDPKDAYIATSGECEAESEQCEDECTKDECPDEEAF